MSLSNFLEDKLLDLAFNGTAYSGQSTVYVKLHLGDPGEAGTNNAATHTTRAAVTFGASSGGVVTSDSAASFTNVAATETYTHVSVWDHVSAGNCMGSGALLAPQSVSAGDNYSIPSGQLTVAID